jgi:hypothetical protein
MICACCCSIPWLWRMHNLSHDERCGFRGNVLRLLKVLQGSEIVKGFYKVLRLLKAINGSEIVEGFYKVLRLLKVLNGSEMLKGPIRSSKVL